MAFARGQQADVGDIQIAQNLSPEPDFAPTVLSDFC